MRTIIVTGLSGAGKTEVAIRIAEHLRYKHICPGDIVKSKARAAGFEVHEFLKRLGPDSTLDRDVDDYLLACAAEGQSVIESRILPWIIPKASDIVSVWLECDSEVRMQRVCSRTGSEAARLRTIERDLLDINRWKDKYGCDINDKTPIDLIVNTTSISIEDAVQTVIAFLQTVPE